MLQKYSHFTLSFLLLLATTGIVVSKHYCGDSLFSTVLFGETEPSCDDGSCCHNETAFYQVDDNFSVPALSQIPQNQKIDLFLFTEAPKIELLEENNTGLFFKGTKPPPSPKIQILLSLKQAWIL